MLRTYNFLESSILLKTIYGFLFGIGGMVFIFFEFAFSPDANNVVVAYFCLISLTSWFNLGLPVDKLVSAKELIG